MGLASSKRLASTGWNVAICDMNEAAGEVALAELTATYPQQKFWVRSQSKHQTSSMDGSLDQAVVSAVSEARRYKCICS